MKTRDAISWIRDEVDPKRRSWEEFYRNRWQYDKIVRSTHGVNCTGGCTWQIHVKDGIVTWEMQGLDYPLLESGLPPYEPRGCQRGISYSWYLYSPLRVKYPYVRGALIDLWKQARAQHEDPVEAWKSLVENPESRQRWQKARGKGGLRRADWDTMLELIAAANIYTIKKYGPDRIAGFSPIPAMSMISHASGARMLQLMGGVFLSFYDWYADLPSASPEAWGEQTDVHESADWYNAKLLAVMGSNLNMTRTPDCHFAAEARHNGSKMWVFSPDFSQVSKYADEWVAINAGQDGAWWMAVNHVLLKEFHHEKKIPYFLNYAKQYTDSPYLVELTEHDGKWQAGKLLRANRLEGYQGAENGEWKFLMWDAAENRPKMPMGSVGFRWGKEKRKWNLLMKDGVDGSAIDPALTLLAGARCSRARGAERLRRRTNDHALGSGTTGEECERRDNNRRHGLRPADGAVRSVAWAGGRVSRELRRREPALHACLDRKIHGYQPASLAAFCPGMGEHRRTHRRKCTVIIGVGVNHWYHDNLMYRAAIHALMFCGCIGVNGGGLAHYVGQEKLAPGEPWSAIAFGRDWFPAARLQNAPKLALRAYRPVALRTRLHRLPHGSAGQRQRSSSASLAHGHTMDLQVRAVRSGWLPFYPQFQKNPLEVVKEAEASGAKNDEAVVDYAVQQLKQRKLKFSVEDPDAPENWPRVWFIWRGNALMASAKGHEYFLKHYLGTHTNAIAEDLAEGSVHEVVWHKNAPQGKMDLVVDLNFRMDTSALYSDIVLPAATWYEKADLNTTDMHSFIHPLSEAVPPAWESKSDWQIFRAIAKKFSKLAEKHFPEPVKDLVASPLLHDSVAEIAQPDIERLA